MTLSENFRQKFNNQKKWQENRIFLRKPISQPGIISGEEKRRVANDHR
jgi:hypothetical protein